MAKRLHDGCDTCPFRHERFTQVSDFGPVPPKYIVIGEGPGQEEAFYGQPFVGPSGKLLRALFQQHGVDHISDVYYMNVTQCWNRQSSEKEAETKKAAACCDDDFFTRLAKLPANAPILLLGKVAQDAMAIKEQYTWVRAGRRWCMAVIHPAAVLRSPNSMIYLEKGIEKFLLGPPKTDTLLIDLLPWERTYEVNPYPLPEIDQEVGIISLDVETTGFDWHKDHIFLVGIATQRGDIWLFTWEVIDTAEWQAWIRAFFEHHWLNIGGHNFKFDMNFLVHQFGVRPVIGWDTELMVNVHHEHWAKGLKELAAYFFDAPDWEEEFVKPWTVRMKKTDYSRVPDHDIQQYLVGDVVYALRLYFQLKLLLEQEGQWDWPYQQHEIPQINLLLDIEQRGFVVDTARLLQEQTAFSRDAALIREAVQTISDGKVQNPGSYKQVGEYMYKTLGLKPTTYTPKGKPSTSEEAIRGYKDIPFVQALLAYRRVTKLQNSYIDNLPDKLHPDKEGNQRGHTKYNAAKVVTHRLSAEAPAAQTVPHEDLVKDRVPDCVRELYPGYEFIEDYSVRVKNMYTAPPGYVLVGVDGMSWEVWTATVQSHDQYLAGIFNAGESPHTGLCRVLYGDTWTKAQKVREKNIFFGWIYGGGAPAVAYETGIPKSDVQKVMDLLEARLPELKAWRLKLIEQAMEEGKVVVPKFNYHMHFELITPQTKTDVRKCAINYVNQGLGSMLISMAAIVANPELKRLGGGIVALVHDAFYAEVPEGKVEEAQQIMTEALLKVGRWFSKFAQCGAETMVGTHWGSMKEV